MVTKNVPCFSMHLNVAVGGVVVTVVVVVGVDVSDVLVPDVVSEVVPVVVPVVDGDDDMVVEDVGVLVKLEVAVDVGDVLVVKVDVCVVVVVALVVLVEVAVVEVVGDVVMLVVGVVTTHSWKPPDENARVIKFNVLAVTSHPSS